MLHTLVRFTQVFKQYDEIKLITANHMMILQIIGNNYDEIDLSMLLFIMNHQNPLSLTQEQVNVVNANK